MQNATQLRLLCQPYGDLPLTLDWLKDGQLIYTHSAAQLTPSADLSSSGPNQQQQQQQQAADTLGRYHVSTRRSAQRPLVGLDSELVVANPRRSDAGLYTCAARNAYGSAERKLRLLVQEPPEAPQLIDLVHISSRSVGLRWLAPFDGNSPILRYIVEFRKQPAGKSSCRPLSPPIQLSPSANRKPKPNPQTQTRRRAGGRAVGLGLVAAGGPVGEAGAREESRPGPAVVALRRAGRALSRQHRGCRDERPRAAGASAGAAHCARAGAAN